MGAHTHEVNKLWLDPLPTYASSFRHQILLKATSMGLKESTIRVNKRRRGPDDASGTKSPADTMSAVNPTTGPW